MKINFNPLFETLMEKDISLIELEKAIGISSSVTAKFRKGEHVNINTLIRICKFLNVPIEKVMEVELDD